MIRLVGTTHCGRKEGSPDRGRGEGSGSADDSRFPGCRCDASIVDFAQEAVSGGKRTSVCSFLRQQTERP